MPQELKSLGGNSGEIKKRFFYMAPIPKEKIKLMFICGFLILILIMIARSPKIFLDLNNGNLTDAGKDIYDTTYFVISTASFVVSFIAMVLTYNSQEITQDTLERTEIEQQKRDITQRLELFYNPMSSYFKIGVGHETKNGLNEDDRRDRVRAYQHRFKADDKTREKFEEWYKCITNPGENGKAIIQKDLVDLIEEDIKKYNKNIKDLDEQIKDNGAKKPWWKLW